MTALTDNRETPRRSGDDVVLTVKAANTIYAGSIVAVEAGGEAVPAADTAGLAVVGHAQNSAAAGETVTVRRGVFRWANNAAAIDASHIGSLATVEDDQTVDLAANTTNDIVAGRIVDVDADGVWVDIKDK